MNVIGIKTYMTHTMFLVLVAVLVWMVTAVSTVQGAIEATWSYSLTGYADTSSPVLADVNNDSFLDVVAATDQGHITVVRHDGTLLWDRDVSGMMGQAANSLVIASSPAVADLDNDGTVEIVVGTGSRAGQCNNDGGIVVLNHNGNAEPGWPVKIPAWTNNLCTVFSSPALADLDNNGDVEIVVGTFAKQLLAYHHTGQLVAGFPTDSPLIGRFPLWPQLEDHFGDTIWSSPAVADIDGDNDLEVFIGTDEGNYGKKYGGNVMNWYCPYDSPTDQYCGGSVHGFSHTGQHLENSSKWIWEHVQSTPAMVDVNQDGVLDIVFGTGTFYDNYNADSGGVEYSHRVHVINSQTGEYLPGWNDVSNSDSRVEDWGGGKVVRENTPASPAVGDISGDGKPEVAAITLDGRLYVWFSNGSLVPGFPMTPLQSAGDGMLGGFNAGKGLILADVDGDGKMEILLNKAWDVVIIDGDGSQLSARGSGNPIYNAGFTLNNLPAVGDMDNDGELELVAVSDTIHVWDLPNSSAEADWPMYKQNAAGTSAAELKFSIMSSTADLITILKEDGDSSAKVSGFMLENSGTLAYNWSVSSVPAGVTIDPNAGTLNAGQQRQVTVTIDSNSNIDESFVVTATDTEGSPAVDSPLTVQVRQIIVDQIHFVYLPVTIR